MNNEGRDCVYILIRVFDLVRFIPMKTQPLNNVQLSPANNGRRNTIYIFFFFVIVIVVVFNDDIYDLIHKKFSMKFVTLLRKKLFYIIANFRCKFSNVKKEKETTKRLSSRREISIYLCKC